MTSYEEDILALYGVSGIGSRTFARLLARFGSPGAVFKASEQDLMSMDGIGRVLAGNIISFPRQEFIEGQKRLIEETRARMITRSSEEYPELLNEFTSAPPILFVRGDPAALKQASVAFVGTRKPSSYGIKMTKKLVSGAVAGGLCIVSGMAAGIDSAAHRETLDRGGVTVAVFGCGLDIIYPSFNSSLADEIAGSGCVVSHFPMGTPGSKGSYPARNAVIVGLSFGTVVVEAPKKSGALITADLTLRAGRPLFTVPGPADTATSEGTNSLLGKGAQPVTDFNAVLKHLGKKTAPYKEKRRERTPPGGLQGEIVRALDNEPLHIEKLCHLLNRPAAEILTELTLLELEGFVSQRPGKVFERA